MPFIPAPPAAGQIGVLADLFLDHRFDLLGSGWVQVSYAQKYPGIEDARFDPDEEVHRSALRDPASLLTEPNRPSATLLRGLIDDDYQAIDWQVDFRSGFRWSESTWYGDLQYGHVRGADIKLPWELGRLQHLPVLASAAVVARQANDADRVSRLYREFRNMLLDFTAANPPRFGTQWVSSMDVGLRIANVLVARELFADASPEVDSELERLLEWVVRAHGRHIASNLDWSLGFRGNHYLANVVGLAFAAAYLPADDESDTWLRFAAAELTTEIDIQFGADGANLEGSTSYHRLSAEMATFGVALLCGLPKARVDSIQRGDKIDQQLLHQLAHGRPTSQLAWAHGSVNEFDEAIRILSLARDFTQWLSGHDGRVAQVGDNDSGRLFKLSPSLITDRTTGARSMAGDVWPVSLPVPPLEDPLDHRHLVDAIDGLLGVSPRDSLGADGTLVRRLIGSHPRWRSVQAPAAIDSVGDDSDWLVFEKRISRLSGDAVSSFEFHVPGPPIDQGLVCRAFPSIGLYVFRSERMVLGVRCGPVGQRGRGGHDHNDQLSLFLSIDGEPWVGDPGTYVYTPFPELRDRYRSIRSHFAPQLDGPEPAGFGLGLFALENATAGSCRYFGARGFMGSHEYADGRTAGCTVALEPERILVRHAALVGRLMGRSHVWRGASRDVPYSPGYGMVEKSGGAHANAS